MKLHRIGTTATLAVVASIALAACGNDNPTGTTSPAASGAGRENLLAGAVDFAGSDAALDEEERAKVVETCGPKGAMNIPVYISPVAVPFNLKGVTELNLKPDTLAKIFDRKITVWNDPAIAADNPGAALPATKITVVNRSDESGTT